jgi:hypothetical protein
VGDKRGRLNGKGAHMIVTLPTAEMTQEQKTALIVGRRMMLRARSVAQSVKKSSPGKDLLRTTIERLTALADNEGVEPKDRIAALKELAQIAKFGIQVEIDSLKAMTTETTRMATARLSKSSQDDGGSDTITTLLNIP